jgi:ABC-type lipoprotein release transport system permease subunit
MFAGVLALPHAARAQADLPAVLVSRQLADTRSLAVGSVITLATAPDGAGGRQFRVAGVYEPTPDPSRLGSRTLETRLHLPDLLDLTRTPGTPSGADHVEAINVALVDPAGAAVFARDVVRRAAGADARPTGGVRDAGPFLVLERFHLAIAAVTIIAATVFLLALTVMLVDERRETVGVLRLIGLPVRRILTQVLLEGLLVASAGALFGVVVALASEVLINRFFQWRYDTLLIFVRVTPGVAAQALAIAIPLGAAATVVASWVMLRRNGLTLARR